MDEISPLQCQCCLYLKTFPQTPTPNADIITSTCNSAVETREITRLTKIWFLETAIFKIPRSTRINRKEDYNQTYDDNGPTNYTGSQKRTISEVSSSDDDSDDGLGVDALWSSAKKYRVTRTPERDIIENIEAVFDGTDSSIPLYVIRLLQFVKLLQIFNTHPDADTEFEENETIVRMMIASHLKLIIGKKNAKNHSTELYPLIESKRDLSNIINVLWETNRQQGKTEVLSRFAAALVVMAPEGGDDLLYVYSTTHHRAMKLVQGAHGYLEWVNREKDVQEKIHAIGLPGKIRFFKENTECFEVDSWTTPGYRNMVVARPGSHRSCRGDGPKAAFFDEIAFVEKTFWEKFAYPLLGVKGRVFTLATTPPSLNDFFDVFTKKTAKLNARHNYFFYLVNHSLMCDACFKAKYKNCSHKLYLIPPWKSTLRFKGMLDLVPEKGQAAFQAEVYGRMYESDESYFPRPLVEYTFLSQPTIKAPNFGDNPVVYIAVDPASHSVSYMGITAVAYTVGGIAIVLGMAELSMKRCEIPQVNMCVSKFTSRVLNHSCFRKTPASSIRVIPVVECNNNEILSHSIVVAIREMTAISGCSYTMPFKRQYFATAISEDIGIWCTEENKLSAIRELNVLMTKHQIRVVDKMVTLGPVHLSNPITPSAESVRQLLVDELVQFKDDAKGKVSGKTAETNDDLAISLLWAVEYSTNIQLIASRENLFHVPRNQKRRLDHHTLMHHDEVIPSPEDNDDTMSFRKKTIDTSPASTEKRKGGKLSLQTSSQLPSHIAPPPKGTFRLRHHLNLI